MQEIEGLYVNDITITRVTYALELFEKLQNINEQTTFQKLLQAQQWLKSLQQIDIQTIQSEFE